MPNPRTHTTFPSAPPLEPPAFRILSEKLIQGTAVAFGTLASLFGIAAGSLVIFGLIIRAQPDGDQPAKKIPVTRAPAESYVKASRKVLVMRASAK